MTNSAQAPAFKVADLSLASFGRLEIELAEHEMPGLMAMRSEFGDSKPLERRSHHRLAAHDRSDGCPHRDPCRARSAGSLGQLQHLLHAGPRSCSGSRSGRTARQTILAVCPSSLGRASPSRSTGGAPTRRSGGPRVGRP